jgi:hypothetical protein
MDYYRLTIPIPKRPLQLLKFRISTALLLTAILAMALAWYRDHKQLTTQMRKTVTATGPFSPSEATGPPNTNGYGDQGTSWASRGADNSKEWLELEYDQSVVPDAILIYENNAPGAVTKVTHISYWGYETTLWEGKDPTAVSAPGGLSRLPVTAGIKTGHIKIYVDSRAVLGWNEIDAVGLEYGKNKQVIWATEATASSSFADPWPYSPYGVVLQR